MILKRDDLLDREWVLCNIDMEIAVTPAKEAKLALNHLRDKIKNLDGVKFEVAIFGSGGD